MTIESGAPPIIPAIAVVLSKSPAWQALFTTEAEALAACWYPEAPSETSPPFAEVSLEGRDGKVTLFLSADTTVAEVQALGDALTYEMQSRYRQDMTGALIPSEPVASDVFDANEADKAGNNPTRAIVLTFPVGIQL